MTGATPNPVIQNPDAIDEEFVAAANRVLSNAVELIRSLVGAHQSAIAIIVQEDWSSIRKFFSLDEASKHPPMRGWLAAPIVGRDGTNWGLLQLSDKYEGEFTEEDEKQFIRFATLVSETLEALWDVRKDASER